MAVLDVRAPAIATAALNMLGLVAGPSYPQRILAIADLGISANSTSTLMHALYSAETSPNPPVLFYIGDFCCTHSPYCLHSFNAKFAGCMLLSLLRHDPWLQTLTTLATELCLPLPVLHT